MHLDLSYYEWIRNGLRKSWVLHVQSIDCRLDLKCFILIIISQCMAKACFWYKNEQIESLSRNYSALWKLALLLISLRTAVNTDLLFFGLQGSFWGPLSLTILCPLLASDTNVNTKNWLGWYFFLLKSRLHRSQLSSAWVIPSCWLRWGTAAVSEPSVILVFTITARYTKLNFK